MLFISPEKVFSFLRYLNFCSDVLGHAEKWLNKKAEVNFKIYDVIDWEANIYSTLISRSKGNETMKFGQLMEFELRNTFLTKCYSKYGRETSSTPFSEKPRLSTSLDQQSETLYGLLLLHIQVKDYLNILKLRCPAIVFASYKAFSENKKRPGTSLLALFSGICFN